jgi:hypothetical protein
MTVIGALVFSQTRRDESSQTRFASVMIALEPTSH